MKHGHIIYIFASKDRNNNLVTTARTTHQPEQKETTHLIQMLRRESNSGAIDDMAHVVSAQCLSDALTALSSRALMCKPRDAFGHAKASVGRQRQRAGSIDALGQARGL